MMGYTVYFNSIEWELMVRLVNDSWNRMRDSEDGYEVFFDRVVEGLEKVAVSLGDMGYSSHGGDEFRDSLDQMSAECGVDLSQLWYREEITPWGEVSDSWLGGLTRDEIVKVAEHLRVLESDDALDDDGEELLILLERAERKNQGLVTWVF